MSQSIRSMGMYRYDTIDSWSPCQGSGSWWHSQEKGGLITSQPSHLCEMLVGNIATTGHYAMAVSPN
jgi:hypothetical protein